MQSQALWRARLPPSPHWIGCSDTPVLHQLHKYQSEKGDSGSCALGSETSALTKHRPVREGFLADPLCMGLSLERCTELEGEAHVQSTVRSLMKEETSAELDSDGANPLSAARGHITR